MAESGNVGFLTGFGMNLKKIREKKRLSYRELAANCNVDHSNIAKIEKGEISIGLKTVLELSKGLDIHPKKLFDFTFDPDL